MPTGLGATWAESLRTMIVFGWMFLDIAIVDCGDGGLREALCRWPVAGRILDPIPWTNLPEVLVGTDPLNSTIGLVHGLL